MSRPRIEERKCVDCRFFGNGVNPYWEHDDCRRHAPVRTEDGRGLFPITTYTNSCGDFELKGAPEGANKEQGERRKSSSTWGEFYQDPAIGWRSDRRASDRTQSVGKDAETAQAKQDAAGLSPRTLNWGQSYSDTEFTAMKGSLIPSDEASLRIMAERLYRTAERYREHRDSAERVLVAQAKQGNTGNHRD